MLSLLPLILAMFLVPCIKTYFLGGIVIIKKAQLFYELYLRRASPSSVLCHHRKKYAGPYQKMVGFKCFFSASMRLAYRRTKL
jgi:hypothetical protein